MKIIKEQWIEDVLQTARDIAAVESNPYMLTRIEARLQQKPAQIPIRFVYATVAAITIILFINISVWRTANNSGKQNPEVQQLVQEYGWVSHDIYSNTN